MRGLLMAPFAFDLTGPAAGDRRARLPTKTTAETTTKTV
jgi:hypothetical protein